MAWANTQGYENARYVQGYLKGYQVLVDGEYPRNIFYNDIFQTSVI